MDAAETPEGPEATAYDGGRPAWQHRLLAGGDEPDPRFTLANERTFLAWVRTALALLAGGVAVEAFTGALFAPPVRVALSTVLLVLAAAMVGVALLFTGGVVGLLSGSSPLARGLRQLAIGYGAAAVTYVLGLLFGANLG